MVSDGLESGWTRLPAPRSPCCLLCASLPGSQAGLGLSLSDGGVMAWLRLGLCNFFLLLCTAVPQFPYLKTVQASSLGSGAACGLLPWRGMSDTSQKLVLMLHFPITSRRQV